MKASPDKCHILVTTNALTSININGFLITNSDEGTLLGIKFDNKLSFENHVSSLCIKASQKLHALSVNSGLSMILSMTFPNEKLL